MAKLLIYMAHDRENGKCYFGSTFQSLEKRIKQHIYYAKKKLKGHFYAALALRPEKFFWLKVSEHEVKSNDRSMEDKIIKKYWGQDWLYNQNPQAVGFASGKYNPNQTQEWKDLMKERLGGKNNPMYNNGFKGKKNPMYGTKPWNNPNGKQNSKVWKNAIYLYNVWMRNNKPGVKNLKKYTNNEFSLSNLVAIHKKFKFGWVPSKDPDYLKWINFL